MKKIIIKTTSKLFSLFSSGAPEFIYTKLLKPWPLRQLTNAILYRIIPEKVTLKEGEIFLNKKDPVISGALAMGVYENKEIALFRSTVKPGMTVLDIGANIGEYTIIASSLVGDSGKVVSFEPEPENYKLLSKNIKHNKRNNVQAFQYGLADKESKGVLYLSSDNKGKHSMAKLDGENNSIQVSIKTADQVLSNLKIEKVDIIKIDIEGAEALALKGMTNVLEKSSPCILFCEFYPEALRNMGSSPLELLSNLSSLGFLIFEIKNKEDGYNQIKDFSLFVEKFKTNDYTNLYCVKS